MKQGQCTCQTIPAGDTNVSRKIGIGFFCCDSIAVCKPEKPCPTDLKDTEWHILEPLIPAAKPGGRSERYPKREIVNALLDVVRTDGAWRFVPNDLPPWGIVYHDLWCWRKDGTWKRINDTLRGDPRVFEGRTLKPSERLDSDEEEPC